MRSDRRRHARFELVEGTFGVLTSRGKDFLRAGPVANIPEGGAAFKYAHRDAPPRRALRLHLFGPDHSHVAVPGIPYRIISDRFSTVTPSTPLGGFCSVAFDTLPNRERLTLEEFIRVLKVEGCSGFLPKPAPGSLQFASGNEEPHTVENGDQTSTVGERPAARGGRCHPVSVCKTDTAMGGSVGSRLGSHRRREILAAYEEVLEAQPSSVKPASSLPYPKELIGRAIIEELANTLEADDRIRFELSFAQLESFLEPSEYELVEKFATMESFVDELEHSGSLESFVKVGELVREFPGDVVVGIFRRVAEQMRIRLAEVRGLTVQSSRG